MEQSRKKYKRVVIKIGSSILCADGVNWDKDVLNNIAEQVAQLIRERCEVVIVSSGAIASGMHVLGLKTRPKELPQLQAAASLGQNLLMDAYGQAFRKNKIHPAQILLTSEDLDVRKRYINAKNTLLELLKMGNVVPIINENDTISTEEIKFGDNDRLSARVAGLISADILIILSDVDGLWDEKKETIRLVAKIDAKIKSLACPTDKKACVGGMITKLEAAEMAVNSGTLCVITNGRKKNIILSVLESPETQGTMFLSKHSLSERERWIAHTKPKGKIFIDDGAKEAILKNHRSLLAPGIVNVEGDFKVGDPIKIVDKDGVFIASATASAASVEMLQVMGRKHPKEMAHRDNMVIVITGED
ncbi:MAG: glutamate 5-kinase [Candidatus Omnitrophica bacterium]|nr:glutamate 5-kinase [Candidatus Omnitrophota bacterium]MDD5236843.1 glutamate 5-kinase [Candidatus Omnitrophota bacterium]MDD5610148.1 glutamate 5-kinase [Candidatus Omnitrophota bacterium]